MTRERDVDNVPRMPTVILGTEPISDVIFSECHLPEARFNSIMSQPRDIQPSHSMLSKRKATLQEDCEESSKKKVTLRNHFTNAADVLIQIMSLVCQKNLTSLRNMAQCCKLFNTLFHNDL
jgi:hypothetical protein